MTEVEVKEGREEVVEEEKEGAVSKTRKRVREYEGVGIHTLRWAPLEYEGNI